MKKIQNVRGTKDLLEEEFSHYQEIIDSYRKITFKFGFNEYKKVVKIVKKNNTIKMLARKC